MPFGVEVVIFGVILALLLACAAVVVLGLIGMATSRRRTGVQPHIDRDRQRRDGDGRSVGGTGLDGLV